mgnify:FL=1
MRLGALLGTPLRRRTLATLGDDGSTARAERWCAARVTAGAGRAGRPAEWDGRGISTSSSDGRCAALGSRSVCGELELLERFLRRIPESAFPSALPREIVAREPRFFDTSPSVTCSSLTLDQLSTLDVPPLCYSDQDAATQQRKDGTEKEATSEGSGDTTGKSSEVLVHVGSLFRPPHVLALNQARDGLIVSGAQRDQRRAFPGWWWWWWCKAAARTFLISAGSTLNRCPI